MTKGVLRAVVPPSDDATAVAERVAGRAAVSIRQLHDLEPMQEVVDLFVDVWQTRGMDPPVNRDLLRALAHAGAYVAAAYVGDELVGASVGFFAADGALHSHISGVRSGVQGRSIGYALKLDQRAWCLDRGIGVITWTFDPLVRRNAWFNLRKLGATCGEYLRDFYGPMQDGMNAGDSSDRLVARWDLLSPQVLAATAGEAADLDVEALRAAGAALLVENDDDRPVAHQPDSGVGRPTLLVGTPTDVIDLRGQDLALATSWRQAVRAALEPAMASGYRVTGITRSGYYVLTPIDGHSQ